MGRLTGAGCRSGWAEGRLVWIDPVTPSLEPARDRPAEIRRFRRVVAEGVRDLEAWSDRQETVAARLLLHGHREALADEAWQVRAGALMDRQGISASAAAWLAAEQVAHLLRRDAGLGGRAADLLAAARWVARRLLPRVAYPADAVFAAAELAPGELLDLPGPILLGGSEPLLSTEAPLVWGVAGLSAELEGLRVRIDGCAVILDGAVPSPVGGLALHPVDGDPEGVLRRARESGERPVALVRRLDDLAAVTLYASDCAAIAVDLERLGRLTSLKHPGLLMLLQAAAAAGPPLLAAGRPAEANPAYWLEIGFSGIYRSTSLLGGTALHALRGDQEGGL